MANGDADAWDETSPAAGDVVSVGAAQIRYLRGAVRQRLLKEHVEPAAGNVGGEHKAGSAVSYIGDYSGAFPTLRPDGATTLTADDLGRLAYNTDDGQYRILTNHVGPVWSIPGYTPTTVYDGEESITFPNGLILKHGFKTQAGVTDVVAFDEAFPNALISVTVTIDNSSSQSMSSGPSCIDSEDVNGFDINQTDQSAAGHYWQAWGH